MTCLASICVAAVTLVEIHFISEAIWTWRKLSNLYPCCQRMERVFCSQNAVIRFFHISWLLFSFEYLAHLYIHSLVTHSVLQVRLICTDKLALSLTGEKKHIYGLPHQRSILLMSWKHSKLRLRIHYFLHHLMLSLLAREFVVCSNTSLIYMTGKKAHFGVILPTF